MNRVEYTLPFRETMSLVGSLVKRGTQVGILLPNGEIGKVEGEYPRVKVTDLDTLQMYDFVYVEDTVWNREKFHLYKIENDLFRLHHLKGFWEYYTIIENTHRPGTDNLVEMKKLGDRMDVPFLTNRDGRWTIHLNSPPRSYNQDKTSRRVCNALSNLQFPDDLVKEFPDGKGYISVIISHDNDDVYLLDVRTKTHVTNKEYLPYDKIAEIAKVSPGVKPIPQKQ